MLSVSIHKDIGEYTEKVVGKMSLRTLSCVVGGLAVSVGVAALLYLGFGVNPSDATLPVMACSMPFWLAGFWRPKGLRAEEFCRLYAAHALSDGKLLYAPGFLVEAPQVAEGIAAKPDGRYRRRSRRKGAERHEPSKR